jgi:hypothetical protein
MTEKREFTGENFELTMPCILIGPTLVTPRAYQDKGDPKFSSQLGFRLGHPDTIPMKQLCARLARAKFGEGVDFSTLKFPFKRGDELADKAASEVAAQKPKARLKDYLRGLEVLTARSGQEYPPMLAYWDKQRNEGIDLPDDLARRANKAKFFSGAEALVKVAFIAYDAVGDGGRDGVSCRLSEVMVTGGGKMIGEVRSAASTFKGYAGRATPESVVGKDEIPF